MTNIHDYKSGFALIESVVILLVLAIIGTTGYLIWLHQHPSDKTIQRNNIAKLNFTLYAPSSLPSNWILDIASVAPEESIGASTGVINQPTTFNYFALPKGDIQNGIQINEFRVTPIFNPPSSCGGLSQDTNNQGMSDDMESCTLIASSNGLKIYWGTDPNNQITNGLLGVSDNGNAAYVVIGDTLITVQVPSTVNQSTLVKILDSFKPEPASYFYSFAV